MDQQPGRIVVGYDGGEDADLALAWAIATCRDGRRPLRVVIAASAMDPVLSDFHERSERLVEEWRARAERIVAESGLPDATVEVQHGTTMRVLLLTVAAADLLVVGSTGHAPLVETVGGSVSQHLARHARCPVVVVRRTARPGARGIVVGVDGSPESIAALRFACARARTTGEDVRAVHGYHAWPFADPDVAGRLAAWVAPVREEFAEVSITEEVAAEPAHRLLQRRAEQASLLVLGSRGRDAFADLLLGSTSQDALHRAHCPVAIVR